MLRWGVYSDLNAAGLLLMYEDRPKGKAVLHTFEFGPSEYAFQRRISDSPHALARFKSTWAAFASFLRASGMIDRGGGAA